MNNLNEMYALSIDQAANLINQVGVPEDEKGTVILEGHMGSAKSSVLKVLSDTTSLSGHRAIYFDCTTKADAGDLMMPKFKDLDGNDYVTFATNEELGVHLKDQPLLIMIDEVGKNRSIQNPLNRLFQERMIGMNKLHPESLVFGTTNIGTEGVGDAFQAHSCNRVTFARMRKPTAVEWIEYMINIGGDHSVLGWVKDNQHVMHSYEDYTNPDDNYHIYHPQAMDRRSFCTPRSLHKASNWLKQRSRLDTNTLTEALCGTIGRRSAMDLMAFVTLSDQLPTLQSIKDDPLNAKVPTNAAAVCMIIYRTLATIEDKWVDAWMTYLLRMDTEAQGMFANGVRNKNYGKQAMVCTNKKFTDWCGENNYMFHADV
tara:strand:- start:1649 stop:2761 length:1113 start_codon:yes stop_codon:yes gene_type:complete